MTMQQQDTMQQAAPRLDTALHCLVIVAQLFGIPADAGQMRRAYVADAPLMDEVTLLRAAKEMGIKSRAMDVAPERLAKMPLPVMLKLTNQNYVVLMRLDGERALVADPYQKKPMLVSLSTLLGAWTGRVILLAKRPRLKEEWKKFGLQWFVPVVIRYKKFFLHVLFLSFILQLFGLITPLFSQVIIDKVLVHRSLSTLDVLIMAMSLVAIFQAWMTGMRAYLFSHTTIKIDVVLSSHLFRHIANLPLRYFENWQVGDIVSRVRELETIRSFLTGSALTLVLDVIFAIVCIGVMLTYSGTLSVVALLALPVFILLNLIITPIFRRLLNDRFLAASENQAFLIEAVTGMQTLKSMAVERTFVQRYEDTLARFVKMAFKASNLGNIANGIATFIQQFFNLAVLWFGAHAVMNNTLTVGELIAFQMLAGQVTGPIMRLINMWQTFQQTRVAMDRLGDIMNEKAEPAFNPNRTTLPALAGEVVLDGVSFRYRQDGAEALRQVSMHIRPGMRVGVVGRSGSGKSTLTKLLQRLYVPERGRVMIDGVDLAQVEPAWLRRQIGVVLQENFLFNGTVRENIAIANPHASEEAIRYVAQMAGADEFIQELPKGYDTPVGERGALLSGGQRQRIAIARALLNDPKVLIFDEATSALDYESERIIMNNLDTIAAGRTMFLIAHRLSTVRRCDLLIVMDHGNIVEQGTHEELLQNLDGYYTALYRQQAG